jgi:EAL domain-containing protein (putative c-di-GMP-specific phosphodiesterase class I)
VLARWPCASGGSIGPGSFVPAMEAAGLADELFFAITRQVVVDLKMNVIAEGVETAEQLEFLRACGGSIVQGFHIARPMPYAACTQWLVRKHGKTEA